MDKTINEVKLFERQNIVNITKFKIKSYYDVVNPCLIYSFYMKDGNIRRFKINISKFSILKHD